MGTYVSDFTRLFRVLVVFFFFLLPSNSPSATLPQFVYPYLLQTFGLFPVWNWNFFHYPCKSFCEYNFSWVYI